MTKRKNSRGFTLAEMLIAVAIIVVLSGVAFVAVQDHQRSSTRLEFDGIAKEIFVAAQNHLTAAQSQGYLDNTVFGRDGKLDTDQENDIYYVLASDSYAIKNLMLPNYAVDGTVLGGSYIIRYQASSATVLDVFYSRPDRSSMLTISGKTLEEGDYSQLMGTSPNYRKGGEENREKYGGAVVGWYGGGEAVPRGERLRIPSFEVVNAESLYVNVTDPNYKTGATHTIKLIIVGQTSKAEKYYTLRDKRGLPESDRRIKNNNDGTYRVMLDDIMSEDRQHFGDIVADFPKNNGKFIPGEDISIKLVAYSTKDLANIAMSAEKSTNSIFADIVTYKAGDTIKGTDVEQHVAGIANFRHLENLDANISNLGKYNDAADADPVSFRKAGQTTDLDWKTFIGDRSVYNSENLPADPGCYVPVSSRNAVAPYEIDAVAPYEIAYDGQKHKIENLKVNYEGDSGLFGTLSNGCSVSNLELIDFDITGTTDTPGTSGNAGALVGTATGTTVTNVLAYHTEKTDAYKTPSVTASNGSAGGLIGFAANSIVKKSAAALVVKGSENAGGLIGASSDGSVTASYAGGHTISITEGDVKRIGYSSENSNVSGATAGGLVGNAGNTEIDMCYSTCSVSGATAGGFVGTASGTIKDSYCTGLVDITDGKNNAFIGSGSPTFQGQNYYYEIINEVITKDANGNITSIAYKGSGTNSEKVKALDESVETYNSFSGNRNTDWDALPYNSDLSTLYGKSETDSRESFYNLKTVERLGASLDKDESGKATDFVATHYGDWPVPEIFFINEGTSSS